MMMFFNKLHKLLMSAFYGTLILLTFLALTQPASAANPKDVSVIEGKDIRLKDVFDGIIAHGDHVLAPAPEPGEQMVLGASSLNRIARAFHLDWSAAGQLDRTIIKRAATVIPHDRIVTELNDALSQDISGEFELELNSSDLGIVLSPDKAATLEVTSLSYDPVRSAVSAVIEAPAGDINAKKIGITGKIHRIEDVPVLTKRLRPGDVIGKRDLGYIKMRVSDLRGDIIIDEKNLIGMTPRRLLSDMQPIRSKEIETPVVVSRGDMVTMILKTPTMSLTAMGKSLNDGSEGDLVRVKNASSSQIVEALVVGPQKVEITTPQSRILN